jgi:pyruvyl transferase EpsO
MLRAITGRAPDHVCTWDAFDADAFRRDSPAGVVFLHGGGNLGDIWPHHQHFREAMLAEFRDRTIVQLPQSIHLSPLVSFVPPSPQPLLPEPFAGAILHQSVP